MQGGLCWYLADTSFKDWAQRATDALLCDGQDSPHAEILKKADKRIIFRLKSPRVDYFHQSVVVKAFPMTGKLNYTGLKLRLLRYRRYGLAEVRNLLEAARRGLPVPQVFGYGRIRRGPLVLNTMVMMEDLAPRRRVGVLLGEAQGQERRQERLLDRLLPVFAQLYRTGCNHIDVNLSSIWLSDNPQQEWKVNDFQFARFLDQPSPRVLMFQAAYFACVCSRKCAVPAKIMQAWVERLLTVAGIKNTSHWLEIYRGFLQNPDLLVLPEARRLALH